MKIGILADSHGDARMTRRAVEALGERGVETLYHCGDVGGIPVLEQLTALPCTLVWGNCDDPEPSALAFAKAVGIRVIDPAPALEIRHGKNIALFHGHESAFRHVLSAAPAVGLFFDAVRAVGGPASVAPHVPGRGPASPASVPIHYLLHGHTHLRRDDRVGHTRIVNPGALYRAKVKTCALINLATDDLTFIELS